ncbi:outer membrane protein assembly factor BamC [Idiomarina seosinensis]|uniref:outer membrane protein assembly factor BamC n=1 Tax=Idiomarina seosinensis TaxID=281739 RepID=UPI00384A6E87
MKQTRVAILIGASLSLAACSSGPKGQASGDFDYADMEQGTELSTPDNLEQPRQRSDFRIPSPDSLQGPVGREVNVSAPRLIRPVALGSRILENETESRVYFDVVDGMGGSVENFVWRAAENVLQRRKISWQQVNSTTWLTETISRAEEIDAEDSSFWDFSEQSTQKIEQQFRYRLTQQPAEHGRTTALTIDLQEAEQSVNQSATEMPQLLQNNIEVALLNAIISEVNRQQQQSVMNQGNQVVPVELGTNNKQQAALIIDMSFENTWPLVGLALEQIGLSVDDLNREAGTYFVDYSAPDTGFFFIGGDDYEALNIAEGEYEVRLEEYNEATSLTAVRDGDFVDEQWLEAIQSALADALQEQNQR